MGIVTGAGVCLAAQQCLHQPRLMRVAAKGNSGILVRDQIGNAERVTSPTQCNDGVLRDVAWQGAEGVRQGCGRGEAVWRAVHE